MRITPLLVCYCACFSMPPRPGASGDAAHPIDSIDGSSRFTNNVVFATSQTYDGSFGGTTGADMQCNMLGSAANLPGPFVAWVSDSVMYPSDRMGSARGWVRPDGKPVADTISDLVAGKMFYPIRLDETGSDTGFAARVWTATNVSPSGRGSDTCLDWTSNVGGSLGTGGTSSATTVAWSQSFQSGCDAKYRLYCFGVGGSAALALPSDPFAKLAFVYDHKIAAPTVTAANALCSGAAGSASVGGSWAALLATTGSAAVSLTAGGAEYGRPDGIAIGIIGDTLAAPINVTLGGAYIDDDVWTGAPNENDPVGTPGTTDSTCTDWSSSTGFATTGRSSRTSASYFDDGAQSCTDTAYLYCVQQ